MAWGHENQLVYTTDHFFGEEGGGGENVTELLGSLEVSIVLFKAHGSEY